MGNTSKSPELVITRTPLRVSFAGGGTDLPDFYQNHYGAVLSTAINKYLYVTVKRHGDMFRKYRLNYSETEEADSLDDIKNDIARECLRLVDVDASLYISTVADLPSYSGLGSSSSFAVGLLNALHALQDDRTSAVQLAEEAAHVEIEVLKHPIGKQDHYAAAFGGMNFFCFLPDGRVTVEPQQLTTANLDNLFDQILMFSTGMWRDANVVLEKQQRNIPSKVEDLLAMREYAEQVRDLMHNGFAPKDLGEVLDNNWHVKRNLATGITNDQIDEWYQLAMDAGASGGKLCGAGGGGFLLFIVTPEHRESVRTALADLKEVDVGFEGQGSRLLLAE